MAWTNIPDSSLEPGKPIRSVDGLALRDNPIAIANGDAGAPKIQTPAYQDASVTFEKLFLGAATRFQSVEFNLTFGNSSGTSFAELFLDVPDKFGSVAMAQWVPAGVGGNWARIYYNGSNIQAEGDQLNDSRLWTVFHAVAGITAVRLEFERPAGGSVNMIGSFLVFSPIR